MVRVAFGRVRVRRQLRERLTPRLEKALSHHHGDHGDQYRVERSPEISALIILTPYNSVSLIFTTFITFHSHHFKLFA